MNPSHTPVETLSKEQVKQGLRDGSITLVDVREPHEYAAGHIPGASLMPLSDFDAQALPHDRKIVFSCNSGRRTLLAIEHARAAGRTDARAHYAGSFNEWKATGEPIETGGPA
jgi:rhodanese-related sulfurtransferase